MRAIKLIVCVLALTMCVGTARADSASNNTSNNSGWFGNDSWLYPNNWPLDLGWLNPHTWPFTLIPLPIVVTDPNAGTMVGLMPVFLFNDSIRNNLLWAQPAA